MLFAILPTEILYVIMLYVDNKSLLSIHAISSLFANFSKIYLRSLLREKLSIITRFNLTNYSTLQLVKLSRFSFTKNISTSQFHSLILTSCGKIYSCGCNCKGELGLSDLIPKKVPTLVTYRHFSGDIIDISTKYNHSLLLTSTNKVYSFGYNSHGQLGQSNVVDSSIPALISFPRNINIIKIATGDYHSLILTTDNQVYSFGSTIYGQLGISLKLNDDYRFVPVLISTIDNIADIAAGGNFSLFLTTRNQVYSCGCNGFGQLGLGSNEDEFEYLPKLISTLADQNIIKISAGRYHSLFLNDNGLIYSVGCNQNKQLGLRDTIAKYTPQLILGINNAIAISAGSFHSLILTNNGQVYAFGASGLIGTMNYVGHNPIVIPEFTEKIIQISAGHDHSLLLTNNGKVYGIGSNEYGKLGLGTRDVYTRIPMFIMSI